MSGLKQMVTGLESSLSVPVCSSFSLSLFSVSFFFLSLFYFSLCLSVFLFFSPLCFTFCVQCQGSRGQGGTVQLTSANHVTVGIEGGLAGVSRGPPRLPNPVAPFPWHRSDEFILSPKSANYASALWLWDSLGSREDLDVSWAQLSRGV